MSIYISPQDMKFVPKNWGYELWIVNNEKYCGKILFIKRGKKCSLHYHNKKDEVLYIRSGVCQFRFFDSEGEQSVLTLKAGEAFHVSQLTVHQIIAEESDVEIIEISTQHFDEDSIRIEAGS